MPRHAFIVTVMPGDTSQAVRSLGLGVYGHTEERDVTGAGQNKVVGRYVLKGVSPDIDADLLVGWHHQIDPVVAAQYADIQNAALRQTVYAPPPDPITRAWMATRMMQMAREAGCSHAWLLQPGDSTDAANAAALLAKFIPL